MKKSRRIRLLALLCVAALLGMYAVTVAAAVTASPYSFQLFLGCLVCTVFVPIFLHIMMRLFAHMSEKKEGGATLHEIRSARRKEKEEQEERP